MVKIVDDITLGSSATALKDAVASIVNLYLGTSALTSVTSWGQVRELLNSVGVLPEPIYDRDGQDDVLTKLNYLNDRDNALLNLDFTSGTLDPRITFTRASTATYYGSDGLLKTAAANEPRFEYDPVTLEPRGLLIEGSSTNLLLHSGSLNVTPWGAVQINRAADTFGPSAIPVFKITETTGTDNHILSQNVSGVVAGNRYSGSVNVAAAGRNFALVGFNGGGIVAFASINLTTGAISTVAGEGGGGSPVFSARPLPNGAWQVTGSATATTTANISLDIRISTDGTWNNRNYTGDGISGLYVWNPQLELSAYTTSYILTTSTAATRAADNVRMLGDNFSSWFNSVEGTFSVDFKSFSTNSTTRYLLAVTQPASVNERIDININTSGIINPRIVIGGSAFATIAPGGYIKDTNQRVVYSYKLGDYGASVGGSNPTSSTSTTTLPTNLDRIFIGCLGGASGFINGHVRTLRYWTKRLANDFLVEASNKDPLDLNFISGVLDPRITFTRASSARYFGSDGLFKTAAAGEPRFDYDPLTLEPRGVLIEGVRTNILLWSTDFTNGVWSKVDCSVSAGHLGVGGPTSATKLIENLVDGYHRVEQSVSFVAGQRYTLSTILIANGNLIASLTINGASSFSPNPPRVYFNLSTGTVGAQQNFGTGTIQNLGGGKFRCTITATPTTSGTGLIQIGTHKSDGVLTHVGGGSAGMFIEHAQFEIGSFASSILTTTTTAATRAADTLIISGYNVSNLFNSVEGTFLADFSVFNTGLNSGGANDFAGIFDADSVNSSNSDYNLFLSAAYPGFRGHVNVAGTSQAVFNATLPLGTSARTRYAIAYKANDFAASYNGAAVLVDSSGTLPATVDRISIGSTNGGAGSHLFGHIRRLRYWPKRKSNTFLQEITNG